MDGGAVCQAAFSQKLSQVFGNIKGTKRLCLEIHRRILVLMFYSVPTDWELVSKVNRTNASQDFHLKKGE